VHERSLQLPTPIRDARTLRTLALLDLESHPPGAGIDRVGGSHSDLTSIAAMSLGLAIVYAGGVAWLTIASQPARSIGAALAAGVVPFVLPDIFKLIVAAGVMPGLWKITGPIAR